MSLLSAGLHVLCLLLLLLLMSPPPSHILSGWCEQAAPNHITHSNSHCHLQGTLALRKTPNYWQEEEGSWVGRALRVLKTFGEDHKVFNSSSH